MGRFVVGVKAIILHDREVLLLRRPADTGGYWEFPGGKLEFGEDLQAALRREIEEETNLPDIRIEKLLYAVSINRDSERQDVGLAYLCRSGSGAVRISEEHTDFLWAGREQVVSLLNARMLSELEEYSVWDLLEIG